MKFSLIHFYKTPLCMAVEKGNIAVVQLLLERKDDINFNTHFFLYNSKKNYYLLITFQNNMFSNPI